MSDSHDRPNVWTWGICGLLLLASTINYMDRQTLANTSTRVMTELELDNEGYGDIEAGFSYAFAVGSLIFGFIADRSDVRWLYPAVLLMWSLAGIATGYVEDVQQLLACRVLLGFFEAGHWPCALQTTQRLLAARDRTLGNSVLQSGTSIGAIVTPLIAVQMLTDDIGSWRRLFVVVGGVGIAWVVLWGVAISRFPNWHDTAPAASSTSPTPAAGWNAILVSRLLVLLVVVIAINVTWHLLRVWLPLFLEKGRGYSERERLFLTSVYNGFTDVGCIAAGAATVWLHRIGWGIQRARVWVYGACATACAATLALPWLERGWTLLAVLFLIAAGSLGLFPCYYAFTQEVSTRHHGKVFGVLSTLGWLVVSQLQPMFGRYVDKHQESYDLPMAVVGTLPLVGAVVLFAFWRETPSATRTN